jgi:hypothetical protein
MKSFRGDKANGFEFSIKDAVCRSADSTSFRVQKSSVKMKLLVVLAALVALASANPFRGGRIFNGRDALVGEAPYMIQFRQIRVGETFAQHFCGGKNSMVLKMLE